MKRSLSSLPICPTSHGVGEKRVLLANGETPTAITQIAVTRLKQGEEAEAHRHETMEEYFFFREGVAELTVGDEVLTCQKDDFVQVPPQTMHRLKALTDMEVLTIGCATDSITI